MRVFLKYLSFKQVACVVAGLMLWLPPAQAAWPSEQPIKLIVPSAIGSITDSMARIVAPPLSQLLGQQIIIENMPGESGHVGTAYAIAQKGDGYSLLYTSNGPLVIEPNLHKGRGRNFPWRDLSPISLIAYTPQILVINREWGVDSLAGLIKKLQDSPGKFYVGSDGVGSKSAVAASLFMQAAKTDLMQVPYSSSKQMMSALLDNQIQLAFLEPGAVEAQLKQNKFMVLAATSTIKADPYALPTLDVTPTFTALGYPTLDTQVWHAILAPAGTPTRIVNKINEAIQKLLSEPFIQQKFQALYFSPEGSTPYVISNRIALETVQWRQRLKSLPQAN
jgi:tripartite-type tricarboxylate transporter receptor subunit TctC